MRVSEVMTRGVQCIDPDASIEQAAQRMKSFCVGALPVFEQDRFTGMVTDRDIVIRSVAGGHDPQIDRVRDVMTPGVLYCFEDQDVANVAEFMKQRQVRRLPVFSRNQLLLGIVSLGDLAIKSDDDQLVGSALGGISEQPTNKSPNPPGPEALASIFPLRGRFPGRLMSSSAARRTACLRNTGMPCSVCDRSKRAAPGDFRVVP